MTTTELNQIVKQAIARERFIHNRESFIEEALNGSGLKWRFATKAMGSGGVGTVRIMNDGSVRYQIGYGTGKYNYARVLIIEK